MDLGAILDLIPVERGRRRKISASSESSEQRDTFIGKELEIRRTLSDSHLLSSAFVVDKYDLNDGMPQRFVLHGAGWGHGVGSLPDRCCRHGRAKVTVTTKS